MHCVKHRGIGVIAFARVYQYLEVFEHIRGFGEIEAEVAELLHKVCVAVKVPQRLLYLQEFPGFFFIAARDPTGNLSDLVVNGSPFFRARCSPLQM